jgi:L-iditol 2-dehydrogenase
MLIAKLHGAHTIVVGTAKDGRRLALASQLGADLVLDVSKDDVANIVQKSASEGPDLVCECAGAAASLKLCLQTIRKGGTLLQLGIYGHLFEVDFAKIVMKELAVIGSFGYTWTSWQRSLKLLSSGKLDAEPLISHELPLSAYDEAFRLTKDGTATKVVFQPQMS